MALGQQRRAVGVFSSRQDAEHALNELHRSGFPMDRVSIIARDSDRQDDIAGVDVSGRVGNKADEGASAGALTGGTLGGLTGLLVGLGALAIPGVGPVVLAGEVATALATTVAGGAIGAAAGGLLGGLIGLGIPEAEARGYNNRVSRGDYLVIVDGNDEEMARAQRILTNRGIQDWGIYNLPGAATGRADYASTSPTNYASTTPMGGTGGRAFGNHQRAVGVFSTRREAEYALHQLRDSGFSMDQVSVVAKDADSGDQIAGADMSDRVGNKADEGAATGAVTGGAVGGLTGLLVGLGALAIPGIGPVMLAGATATAIATTLSGTAIGAAAGSLLGALVGLGIPEEQARGYNDRLSRGHYLVIVDGTESDIGRAGAILSHQGIQDWGVYDIPNADTRSDARATTSSVVDTTRSDARATTSYVVDTTRSDRPASVTDTDPKVIIVDHRDQI